MKTEAWPLLSVMFEVCCFFFYCYNLLKKKKCEGNIVYIVFPNLLADEED